MLIRDTACPPQSPRSSHRIACSSRKATPLLAPCTHQSPIQPAHNLASANTNASTVFYDRIEHRSDTNSKRCTRPIVNPQHRLLAIGTKEFPMDYLLLKKRDSTCLFCARASACALAGVLPFTLPLTFACALPRNAPREGSLRHDSAGLPNVRSLPRRM